MWLRERARRDLCRGRRVEDRKCGRHQNYPQAKASGDLTSDSEAAHLLNSSIYNPLALAAHEAPRESGLHSPLLRLMRAVYRPKCRAHQSPKVQDTKPATGPSDGCLGTRAAADVAHASKVTLRGVAFVPKRDPPGIISVSQEFCTGAESFLYAGAPSW